MLQPPVILVCRTSNEEILSKNNELGALEFLHSLFPHFPCLAVVLFTKLVVLVFQFI